MSRRRCRWIVAGLVALQAAYIAFDATSASGAVLTRQLPATVIAARGDRAASLLEIEANLEVRDLSLEDALDQLRSSSRAPLAFSPSLLPRGHRVSCTCRSVSVGSALDRLLAGTDLKYATVRNQILIEPIPARADSGSAGLSLSSLTRVAPIPLQLTVAHQLAAYTPITLARRAQGVITGRVTEAAAGRVLAGVNVAVIGTDRGAITGAEGAYTISGVPAGPQRVRASYFGFADQERAVNVTSGQILTVNFTLEPQPVQLERIVAVGYATERERTVSGAITSVRAEELNTVSTLSVNQMLRGRAPGLNLRTRSAQPGGGVSADIRGAVSPRGNNTPLYVIDGVPVTEYRSSNPGLNSSDLGFSGGVDRDPLAYLNPADIESITILKDASAAAIYGSAAANGVVLITTKGGRAGAVHMEYTGSYTAERLHDYFPLMNAQQFMREQSRLAYERYLYENRLAPYGTRNPATAPNYTPLFTEAQIAVAGAGTDWLSLVTENGYAQEHNLTLRGGSENTRAYASFNFRGNEAILKASTLNRYTGRLNLDQAISDAARFSIRMTAARLQGDNASTGSNAGGPEKYNMIQAAYAYAPTVPVYDDDGNYAYTYNRTMMSPAAFLTIDDDSRTNTLLAIPSLEVDLLENLTGTLMGQVNQETTSRGFYLPRTTNNDVLHEGMAQKGEQSIHNYSAEGYLTYTGQVGPGELTAVGGAGYYQAQTEGSSVQGVGFFSDAFTYNNLGVASDKLRNSISSWKTSRTKLSQFGRLNYSFLDRYIVTLVARRDGSSIFAEEHKYGVFPGVSAAWIVSDEPFLQRVPVLSQLKLRAGYGLAGNESVLSGNTLQLYSPGYPFLIGNVEYNGVALSQVANPRLSWEKTYSFDLGVDFGIWDQRISGSFDYYVKTARDLLDFNPLPANNAVGRVADNVGATRSQGVELSLHTVNVERDAFAWNTDLNLSRSKSYWLERNPRFPLPPYIGKNDPLDAIYGWKSDGIIRSAEDRPSYMPNANLGNLRYIDQNGDGKLDQMDVVILGNSAPRWVIGVNNTIRYRNFDFTAFVYSNLDYQRYDTYAPDGFAISALTTPANTTVLAREIWSSQNPNGTRPGIADNPYNAQNPAGNDFDLRDASFLRLSNLSLSYTLPRSLVARMGSLESARLFVNVQNLGVLTDYPGFDPEYTEANPYPKYYSTTIGVKVDF